MTTVRAWYGLTFRQKLSWFLLATYVFLIHFGKLTRFGERESETGITTAIALLIIACGYRGFSRATLREPVIRLMLVLLAWCCGASFLSPLDLSVAFLNLAKLSIYVTLALVVAELRLPAQQVEWLILVAIAGLFVATSLTVLDHQKLIDVPGCNDVQAGSRISRGSKIVRIEQASGFYPRRSAMAAIYSISLAASYLVFTNSRRFLTRAACIIAFATGLLCLFLTHNRSAGVGVLLSILMSFIFSHRRKLTGRIAYLLLSGFAATGIIWVAVSYFPDHTSVYLDKFSYLSGGQRGQYSTDIERLENLKYACHQITYNNPVGYGLGNLVENGQEFSSHNIITAQIWAMGILSFLWIPAFAMAVIEVFRRRCSGVGEVVKFSLVAWLFHNMTHESLSTGFAWIFIGLLYSQIAAHRVSD